VTAFILPDLLPAFNRGCYDDCTRGQILTSIYHAWTAVAAIEKRPLFKKLRDEDTGWDTRRGGHAWLSVHFGTDRCMLQSAFWLLFLLFGVARRTILSYTVRRRRREGGGR